MEIVQHPSKFFSVGDTDLIRNYAARAEQQGTLTTEQLQLIYDRDWFRVMVPSYLGGLEWSLVDVMQLCEAASWADGSFGWTLNLGAGANMFSAYLNDEIAQPLFSNKEICIAGSDAAGTAEKRGDEFLINGTWRYATGAPHARFFSVNCVITENGNPVLQNDGKNVSLSFIVPGESVSITGLWKSFGLIATGSHDFKVVQVQVSKEHSFDLSKPSKSATGKLYRFPFLQLAEALLSVTICGMSIHFIDLVEELIQNKLEARVNKTDQLINQLAIVETSRKNISTRRELVYKNVIEAWMQLSIQKNISTELLIKISNSSRDLGHASRIISERLYPFAGMRAIVPDGEINRTWRDIHTASQHVLLQ